MRTNRDRSRDRSLAVVTPWRRDSWRCVPSPSPFFHPPPRLSSDSTTQKRKADTHCSLETGKLPFYFLVKSNQTKSERTRPLVHQNSHVSQHNSNANSIATTLTANRGIAQGRLRDKVRATVRYHPRSKAGLGAPRYRRVSTFGPTTPRPYHRGVRPTRHYIPPPCLPPSLPSTA